MVLDQLYIHKVKANEYWSLFHNTKKAKANVSNYDSEFWVIKQKLDQSEHIKTEP
jgi:hypothetical protein